MPWQGVSPVDLRLRFITEYLTEHYSMTELACAYGISRKTAYYWVRCYERDGPGRYPFHPPPPRGGPARRRRPPPRRIAPPHHLTVPTAPNLVWTVDFKGE